MLRPPGKGQESQLLSAGAFAELWMLQGGEGRRRGAAGRWRSMGSTAGCTARGPGEKQAACHLRFGWVEIKKKKALKSKRGVLAGSESDFPWHPGAARKPWHVEMCHSLIAYNPREAMGHGRHGWQRRGGCGGLPWHGSKHAASAPAESPRGGNDPN